MEDPGDKAANPAHAEMSSEEDSKKDPRRDLGEAKVGTIRRKPRQSKEEKDRNSVRYQCCKALRGVESLGGKKDWGPGSLVPCIIQVKVTLEDLPRKGPRDLVKGCRRPRRGMVLARVREGSS